jgi:hypothetical protein
MVENQGRDVARMSVAVAHKATTLGRLIDGGFEHPEVLLRMTKSNHRFAMNPAAVAPQGKAQEVAVVYVVIWLLRAHCLETLGFKRDFVLCHIHRTNITQLI